MIFLENLKAQFSDALRPNYYFTTFTGPFGIRDFGFQTIGATFPFYTVDTLLSFYNGYNKKYAFKIDYDPITFTFVVDDNNKILTFIDEWLEKIFHKPSGMLGFKHEYVGEIEVALLNRKQFDRVTCKIHNAFPVNVSNIVLAYDNNDQIMKVDVSFVFDSLEYEFNNSLSIAGLRDSAFSLVEGTVQAFVEPFVGDTDKNVTKEEMMIQKASTIFS